MKKITPYMVLKGLRYLRHFGLKEFLIRLQERMEPEEVPYGPWYENYRPVPQELEAQRSRKWKPVNGRRDGQPLFSVLVPVYRTPERYLRDMIESVLSQTFPDWELCIVNADPSDAAVNAVLEEYAGKDARIRRKDLARNDGIAGNTNAALAMADGVFAALLDHDDVLSESALYHMALRIEAHPDTDLLYTDEDKITADGKEHFQPHLKPDLNMDLLRSNNYICHFLAVRRELALAAGGFKAEYDGAQDYDFIFRCVEKSRRVEHVPEILYHWRTHAASTADNPASKMYAYEAGKRAIEAHLARCGVPGRVELKSDLGFYRVIYPVTRKCLVSVIIPNKDQADTLRACLDSIRRLTTWPDYEIIIVENNSTEQATFDYYMEIDGRDGIRVITWDGPFNYAAINNFGFAAAKGEYIVCMNNDIRVITPGWIEEMLGVCERGDVGIVGARLYYPDNTVQHAGIVMGIGGVAGALFVGLKRGRSGYLHKAALMQDLSAVTAACMMISRQMWEKTGGFEEKLAVAFNDVDLCLRVREAGKLVVYDPYAEFYHDESKTRGAENTKQKVRRFQKEIEYMRTRWTGYLRDGDPYYNKNLSLTKWNYSLKSGERMR